MVSQESLCFGDVFWILLSFLALPPERQMEILPWPLVESNRPEVHAASSNPLIPLHWMVLEYSRTWIEDDFLGVEHAASELVELVRATSRMDCCAPFPTGEGGLFTKEGFLTGDLWKRIRLLAQAALDEVGMPAHPLPEKLNFNYFVEIVHDV